jgi:ribosomal protein S18 acetylase RimI-like enzyme
VIEVERLGPDTWRVYRELRLAALADAPTAFGARLEVESARPEEEWRARLALRTQFVARVDGQPVGTVGCRDDEGGEPELVSMWVAPAARGTGVGDRLVEAVIAHPSKRGRATIVLWVSQGNTRAERLYARHGFERTGRTQPIDDDDPTRGLEFEMRRDPSKSATR